MYGSIYTDVVIYNPWHVIVPMFEALVLSGTIQLTQLLPTATYT